MASAHIVPAALVCREQQWPANHDHTMLNALHAVCRKRAPNPCTEVGTKMKHTAPILGISGMGKATDLWHEEWLECYTLHHVCTPEEVVA